MAGIFGDTDDITFGVGMPKTPREHLPKADRRDFWSSSRPRSLHEKKDFPRKQQEPKEPRVKDFQPSECPRPSEALLTLVATMKPSFFPSLPDGVMRFVMFSSSNHTDPLMLIRSEEVSLLVGTGFGTHENVGKVYKTLPDLRLVISEKERLAWWILTNEEFDLELFQIVEEALGFPFVYATRERITMIREHVKDAEFLEKCRFFELFPPGTHERKIASFLLSRSGDGFRMATHTKGCTFFGTGDGILTLSKKPPQYKMNDTPIEVGEIIDIVARDRIMKQSLRFVFDTFYLDEGSFGVVAGYTLSDRAELAENGILTFVIEEDIRMRAIVGHIFIDSRGFVHSHEMMRVHKEILRAIRHIYESALLANRSIERGELVQLLRRELTKYCYLLTGRTPVVMPVIIER